MSKGAWAVTALWVIGILITITDPLLIRAIISLLIAIVCSWIIYVMVNGILGG